MTKIKCTKCSGKAELQSYVKDDNGKVIGGYYLCPICGTQIKEENEK